MKRWNAYGTTKGAQKPSLEIRNGFDKVICLRVGGKGIPCRGGSEIREISHNGKVVGSAVNFIIINTKMSGVSTRRAK